LAYAGLAEGYRSLGLAGELTPKEVFPQAKAAARRAIELDESLAEAHAVLGYIIFWYDWDWKAAENEIKRAVELNPDSADAHHSYATLLSNTGRHTEALAESRRARELDPLDLRISALGGQFLTHAGQADEALAILQKVIELDSNHWLAHSFAASAYIEKGMFDHAIAEARKAKELPGRSTAPVGFLGFALARSGKQAEARAVLQELLKSSKEQYISAYTIAMVYNGLDERDQAIAWLEKAYQNREPRITFLNADPKWNSLRDDPRFQDLVRRVGFPA
ncbi:MAG TPA: tetratricopeptide repeat protein, partial [Pyrinomonadaceae bacterium]|nr:tetratricopeptide repeat protein [Pyrinomonadaceae bacterium]